MKYAIIIPTHNRPELLCNVLRSFQAQTYHNWICIVVDDASTVSYQSIIETFKYDNRINFFRRNINGGVNQACNTGLDIIAGYEVDFIAIVDDDDTYEPDFLEVAANVIKENPEYGWFISNNLGETKLSSKMIKKECVLDYIDDYIYKKFRGDKARLIRADLLKNLRFSKHFRSSHRWPFFIELGEKTKIFAYPHGSIRKNYLDGGVTKSVHSHPEFLDILHRPYKHWYVITKRPCKLDAYKYLILELAKLPQQILKLFIYIIKSRTLLFRNRDLT